MTHLVITFGLPKINVAQGLDIGRFLRQMIEVRERVLIFLAINQSDGGFKFGLRRVAGKRV